MCCERWSLWEGDSFCNCVQEYVEKGLCRGLGTMVIERQAVSSPASLYSMKHITEVYGFKENFMKIYNPLKELMHTCLRGNL